MRGAPSAIALIDRYDRFLLDSYGVLNDSESALPGARELIDALDAAGKPALVVTNGASRLPETASKRFHALGLPIPPERIVTTGELLPGWYAENGLVGKRTMVLGPEDAFTYVARAGGVPVPYTEDAEVLLVADEEGFPFLEAVDAALSLAIRRIDRGEPLHLVLPNPDLIYPKKEGFGITAGSIARLLEAPLAQRYEGRSGLIFARLGKPSPRLFEEAVRRAGTRRVLMIGDQLATDIRGAQAAGLDSALLITRASVCGSSVRLAPDNPTWLLGSLR